MEGMPRFPALVPELKVPANEYDDEFVYRLKEYILMHFQADPSNFDKAIEEIRSIKKEVMRLHPDVQASCVLKRYYSQLVMMKNRFPMDATGEVRTPFAWYERALDIPTAQSIDDIGFEMACVMYQIGAVHAAIAASEPRQEEDSIKNAFMHFQYAAWPFQHIRDSMDVANFATSDFDKELLTFHVNVLLGQAQECLLEKSLVDHRGHVVVAKLAAYLRELYASCNRVLLESNSAIEFVSSKKMKMWSRTCTVKSEIYGCIAMLYMGFKAEEAQKFGERLGYCQAADVHLQRALQVMEKEDRAEMRETVQFVADVVKARLENAKKENDFIYHERIPKVEELLASVEGLGKVHPLAFDPLDPSVGGEDLFGALIPPTVLSAVSQYEEEKAQLKRMWTMKVNERTDELNSFLASLNSTELALSSIGPRFQLPELMLEKNAYMHSQIDAVPRLLEKLQHVDELARVADSKLTGLTTRLAAIDLPEFTGDPAYKDISGEITRLTEHHNQARSNNGELHRALAAHSTSIHLLSLPMHELVAELAPPPEVPPASTKEGAAMIRVLDKAHEMQTQRAALMKKLCDELDADDIANKLLAERDIDNKATFAAELKKHEQTTKYIEANLAAQDNILHHLTEANADFAEQRKVIQDAVKTRANRCMALLEAHDIYEDICKKADEGRSFYAELIKRTDKISMIVEGLEAAYSQEKEKISGEKRALEQKMAALRAAKEAREAMNEFGGPQSPMPGAGGAGVPSQKGSRPRLGDYMEFYRNKRTPSNAPVMPQMPQLPPMPQMHLPAMDSPAASYPQQPPSPAPSSIADYSYNHGEHHLGHGYVLPSLLEAPRRVIPPPQHYASPYAPQAQRYTPGGYDPRLTPQGPPPQPSPTPSQWSNPGYETGPQTPQGPQQYHPAAPYQPVQPAVSNSHYQYLPLSQPAVSTPNSQPYYVQQPSNQPAAPASSYQPPQQFASQTGVNTQLPPATVSSQPTIPASYQPAQQFQPTVAQFSSQPAVLPPQQPPATVLSQPSVHQFSSQPAVNPLPAATVTSHPAVTTQFTNHPSGPTVLPQFTSQSPNKYSVPFFRQQAVSQLQLPAATVPNQPSVQPTVSNHHTTQYAPASQPAVTQQFSRYLPASTHPGGQINQSTVPSSQPGVPVNLPYSQPAASMNQATVTAQQQYNQPVVNNRTVAPHPVQPGPQQNIPPAVTNQPSAVPSVAKPAVTTVVPSHQPQVQPSVINPQQQAQFSNNPAPWVTPRNNFQPSASPWHKTAPSPWHQSPTPASFNQAPAGPAGPTAGLAPGPSPAGSNPAMPVAQAPPPVQQTSNVDLLSSLLGDLQLPAPIQPNQMMAMAPQTVPPVGPTESLSLQRAAASGSSEAPRSRHPGAMTVVPSVSDPTIRPAAAVLPMQQKVAQQEVANQWQQQQMLSMANGSSVSVQPQFFDKPATASMSLDEISNPDKFQLGEGDKNRLEKRQLHSAIRGQGAMPSLDPLDPLNQLDAFWSVKKA